MRFVQLKCRSIYMIYLCLDILVSKSYSIWKLFSTISRVYSNEMAYRSLLITIWAFGPFLTHHHPIVYSMGISHNTVGERIEVPSCNQGSVDTIGISCFTCIILCKINEGVVFTSWYQLLLNSSHGTWLQQATSWLGIRRTLSVQSRERRTQVLRR